MGHYAWRLGDEYFEGEVADYLDVKEGSWILVYVVDFWVSFRF